MIVEPVVPIERRVLINVVDGSVIRVGATPRVEVGYAACRPANVGWERRDADTKFLDRLHRGRNSIKASRPVFCAVGANAIDQVFAAEGLPPIDLGDNLSAPAHR